MMDISWTIEKAVGGYVVGLYRVTECEPERLKLFVVNTEQEACDLISENSVALLKHEDPGEKVEYDA